MASRNSAEIIVGAAILAVAGGFLTYAMANSGRTSVSGYPLTAQFENITGLTAGSDVRMAGVKIGTVEKTSLNPKTFQAVVTLRIRDDIHLPKDSAAQILSDGLLGSQYLGLSPGGDEQVIAPGGQISITTPSVSLEQELGKFVFSVSDLVAEIKKNPAMQGQGNPPPAKQPPARKGGGVIKPLE
ncbi:outer membrane lipid asymmetry maintenance protein MlaD [Granulibacter bethesdensis]|nr:outer membrane lipid asymmetry maintenance protein MlaD [Granulibacter bethesdensis]